MQNNYFNNVFIFSKMCQNMLVENLLTYLLKNGLYIYIYTHLYFAVCVVNNNTTVHVLTLIISKC